MKWENDPPPPIISPLLEIYKVALNAKVSEGRVYLYLSLYPPRAEEALTQR